MLLLRTVLTTVVLLLGILLPTIGSARDGSEIASQYDHRSLRIGMESSLGARQHVSRNAMGDVVGLIATQGERRWEAAITRDVMGLEVDRQLPGGARSYWWRDTIGRPTQHWVGKEQATARGRKYRWGLDFRIEEIVEDGQGAIQYQHDRRGALVATTYPDGSVDHRGVDEVGNLFRTAELQDREYGPVGELRKESTPEGVRVCRYDPEGNLVEREEPNGGVWTYTWDGAGRLRGVVRPDEVEIAYEYDALGRRVSKTVDGEATAWVWDRNVLLHEVCGEGDAAEVTTWVFDPGRFSPAARIDGDGAYSVVTDHLGTPLCLLDDDGAPRWNANIDAWGRARAVGEAELCPWRFAGQYEDGETGLCYNRFRYYDAGQGRYVSRDPIGLAGGAALHGYVDDPCGAFDPLGLNQREYGEGTTIFRGDNDYRGGPVGTPEHTVTAEDIIAHVLQDKRGHASSGLISFSTKRAAGSANSAGAAKFGKVHKANSSDIDGQLLTPDDAFNIIASHPKKKIREQAGDIRSRMERNNEVLLNGILPGMSPAN